MRKIIDAWTDIIVKICMLATKIAMLNNNFFNVSYAVVNALMIRKQIASNRHSSGAPTAVAISQRFKYSNEQ